MGRAPHRKEKQYVYHPNIAIDGIDTIIEVTSPWAIINNLKKNLIKFSLLAKMLNYTIYVFIMNDIHIMDVWKFQGNNRGMSIFNNTNDITKYKIPNSYKITNEDLMYLKLEELNP